MNYWLLKSEASVYSWYDLVREGKTFWNGVRNYQARNNLRNMKVGDLAFFYHSMDEKDIVGVAEIVKEAYPDKDDPAWSMVDIIPVKALEKKISLELMKQVTELKSLRLLRHTRLSVCDLTKQEFETILKLSGTKL